MTQVNSKAKTLFVTIIGILIALLFVFPIIWFALSSFKESSELFTYPLSILPKVWSIDNYVLVLQHGFMQYVYNSLFVAVVATVITVAVSSAAGYALAVYRSDIKYANIFFAIFIMGTLVPGDAQIVSSFDVILKVGLYNNIWGVILPTVASTTGIFLYRQFYTTVPTSLSEAARIDGAGEARIFFTIMFPLAKSTTITLIIFSFMWRWNDYILPLIVLSDQDRFTIQIAIRNYVGNMSTDWNSILSATVLSIIPVIVVFAILQKRIMGGIATSGMKN